MEWFETIIDHVEVKFRPKCHSCCSENGLIVSIFLMVVLDFLMDGQSHWFQVWVLDNWADFSSCHKVETVLKCWVIQNFVSAVYNPSLDSKFYYIKNPQFRTLWVKANVWNVP